MSRSEEETEEMVGDDGGGSSSFAGSNILIADKPSIFSRVSSVFFLVLKCVLGLRRVREYRLALLGS